MKRLVGCVYAIKTTINKEMMKTIYRSLNESVLRYGVHIWGGAKSIHIKKLSNLHRSALKLTQDEANNDKELLIKSKTLTINSLYKLKIITDNFENKSYRRLLEHRHRTRTKRYIVPRTFNSYGERTLSYLVPKLYND